MDFISQYTPSVGATGRDSMIGPRHTVTRGAIAQGDAQTLAETIMVVGRAEHRCETGCAATDINKYAAAMPDSSITCVFLC